MILEEALVFHLFFFSRLRVGVGKNVLGWEVGFPYERSGTFRDFSELHVYDFRSEFQGGEGGVFRDCNWPQSSL